VGYSITFHCAHKLVSVLGQKGLRKQLSRLFISHKLIRIKTESFLPLKHGCDSIKSAEDITILAYVVYPGHVTREMDDVQL
jgi:hypothetical protein